MKTYQGEERTPMNLKRKLMATLSMLLIASMMMMSSGYAWFVLSVAPEVTGINTNIGSNGSLEIALLNTETRQDMSKISSGVVGESLANKVLTANNTWGNLIDLHDSSYGLNNIILMPARISAVANADGTGYTVNSGMLSVPTYGYDGRVIDVTEDTVSAVFANNTFSFQANAQDYGVRAIGTADNLGVQGSALAMAKSNVATYSNGAASAAAASLADNGGALFSDIMVAHLMNSSGTYDDTDLGILTSMISDLQEALDNIDLAMRYGLVACAAASIEDEDTFIAVRDQIISKANTVSSLLAKVNNAPEEFKAWATKLEATQNSLNAAKIASDKLTGGTYTWSEFRGILDYLMNLNSVYVGDYLYGDLDLSKILSMGNDITVTLAPGSGVFANVADFADDFNTLVGYMGKNIELTTATVENPVHLAALHTVIRDLEPAGDASSAGSVELDATYGYALDLAFRCNVAKSDLLLQTAGVQRVYDDSSSVSTLGGGSFMEFASNDESLTITQIILLMDAVRVGFVDDQGNLLGVAKLNTSNRQTVNGTVKAPLFLYEYGFSEEDGSMVMGERRKTDNKLVSMQQNVAKAVTVMVWLDGDVVDNTMVSGDKESSLSGLLNLQFASSADLIPAENTDYMTLATDRTELAAMIAAQKETYDAGQLTYTTSSWNAFVNAYNHAVSVHSNAAANDSQIWRAASELSYARRKLVVVSKDALSADITKLREEMGKTDDVARYIVTDENGNYSAISEYTEEQEKNKVGNILAVNYEKNLRNEGNDVYTAIYTQSSWQNLAAALYQAEAVNADKNATDAQINEAMTALDTAYKALEHGAYFIPYDYNGSLYYYAKPQNPSDDTYGKWYTADFQRIVSDRTILNLDAHAELTTVASIEVNAYSSWEEDTITPYIKLLDEIYPELKNEQIIGITWNELNTEMFTEHSSARHTDALNELIKTVQDNNLDVDTSAAEALLNSTLVITAEKAETEINKLSAAVNAAMAEKAVKEAEEAAKADPYMSADQRMILTKAVNLAKSVEGFHEEENTTTPDASNEPTTQASETESSSTTETETQKKARLEALRTATAEAEAILVRTDVLKADAEAAIKNMNNQLVANGMEGVNAYNTVVYNIPVGSEAYEIVYANEYPGMTLSLSGKTGTSTLGIIGVTQNGVVLVATQDVVVYTPADDMNIVYDDTASTTITVGESLRLDTALLYSNNRNSKETELKNVFTNDQGELVINVPEHIKVSTWASSDTSIATVSGGVVTGVKPGPVKISVSAETVEGNIYTDVISITVKAAP